MKTYGTRQWFIAAAEQLDGRGYAVDSQRKWLSKGYLIWKLNARNNFEKLNVVL